MSQNVIVYSESGEELGKVVSFYVGDQSKLTSVVVSGVSQPNDWVVLDGAKLELWKRYDGSLAAIASADAFKDGYKFEAKDPSFLDTMKDLKSLGVPFDQTRLDTYVKSGVMKHLDSIPIFIESGN